MNSIIEQIKLNTKSNYKAKVDEKGKLIKNIANFGANIGTQGTVSKNGEYHGFSVEFLSKVKPLFTDNRILRSLEYIENEDFSGVIRILDIEDDYSKYGKNIIFYVIENWFLINNLNTEMLKSIKNFDFDYDKKKIPSNNQCINRLKILRHDSIDFPIKIIGIGKSKKGNSVVPENWLGREFLSGKDLHNEMNNLDWRKNKPKVNFCCIYSMSLIENNHWTDKENILNVQIEFQNLITITCLLNNSNKIKTSIIINENPIKYIEFHKQDTKYYYDRKKDLLICMSPNIFKNKAEYQKNIPVSVLVSRLQKSFRRGSKSSKILYNTVNQLNDAHFYNLPDQHFAKVSGTRQLFWRAYISIIEDVCGYYHPNVYDLLDLLVLSLICQINPDLQMQEVYLKQINNTLLNIQNINYAWPWRKGIEMPMNKFKTYGLNSVNDPILRMIDSMILALKFMPMMSGDRVMLSKCVNYLAENQYNYNKINYMDDQHYLEMSLESIENEVLVSSNDMHCYPNILLSLQGSIPFLPNNEYTTYKLSSFIWNNSSKYNIRYSKENTLQNKDLDVLNTLKQIQKNFIVKYEFEDLNNLKLEKNKFPNLISDNKIPNEISRLAFILLFGQKLKLPYEGKNNPALDIILAGDIQKPCKVKKNNSEKYIYLENKERFQGEKRYVSFIENGIFIELPEPPKGYKWNLGKKIKIKARIVKSDETYFTNDIDFYVNNIKIRAFDASIFLDSVGIYQETELDEKLMIEILENALYLKKSIDGLKLNMIMRNIGVIRNNLNDHRVFSVDKYLNKNNDLIEVWRQLYSRIETNNILEIGPIDRSGNKTHKSINYKYEGVYWRLLNLLFMLFPFAIILKNDFKFELNLNDPSYYNMINLLQRISFANNIKYESKNNVIVKTKLWEHQEKSVNKIFNGMINSILKKGFGDASCMGAGKTLTALSIISKLYNYNIQKKITNYRSFLIMVPGTQLYKTWEDEINKHTQGFDIIFQNADGTLTKKQLYTNSIVISTMSRVREHPISNPWILVVIDECLTVQNKEALQTEEALRQATASQFNCILLSATFFRTRFDKLFYMLKMLKTGIPEKLEYLDTILAESLVCNIVEGNRKWINNVTKRDLLIKQKNEYEKLIKNNLNEGYEKIYVILNKYIHDNVDYVNYFKEKVKELEAVRPNSKILIYSKSKEEADKLASECIGRYPDISKRHVVVSYTEGTYGLNDLVIFNTILTRPPNPDALPQMKGRLDRNGQKDSILYLEYILLKDTIEEALLIRLDMANNFHNSHILPLAEFYKIAIESTKQ